MVVSMFFFNFRLVFMFILFHLHNKTSADKKNNMPGTRHWPYLPQNPSHRLSACTMVAVLIRSSQPRRIWSHWENRERGCDTTWFCHPHWQPILFQKSQMLKRWCCITSIAALQSMQRLAGNLHLKIRSLHGSWKYPERMTNVAWLTHLSIATQIPGCSQHPRHNGGFCWAAGFGGDCAIGGWCGCHVPIGWSSVNSFTKWHGAWDLSVSGTVPSNRPGRSCGHVVVVVGAFLVAIHKNVPHVQIYVYMCVNIDKI